MFYSKMDVVFIVLVLWHEFTHGQSFKRIIGGLHYINCMSCEENRTILGIQNFFLCMRYKNEYSEIT
jgi:hypothetical protein